MRTATTIEASSGKDAVEFAVEAERLGLDVCWVAEAWGADAPSPLGYLAARTERMLLGSGVIQVGTRSPVTIAQTAMMQRAVEFTRQFAERRGFLAWAESSLERANLPLRAAEAMFFYVVAAVLVALLAEARDISL